MRRVRYEVVLLLALGGSAVWADDGPVFELQPITVSPYQLPFAVEEFPGSMEVLTREDLAATGVQSLSEALESVANIPMTSFSGNAANAEVDLRGYGENSGLRTLILVDGQPLNRVDMGTPSWLEIPVGRVERVEVLRGPQTARFGNYATGGVINIVTRLDAADAPQTQLEAGLGSDATFWARASHRRPLLRGAISVQLEHNETDGYRENGGYEADSVGVNYGRQSVDGSLLRLGLFYLDSFTEFPGPLSTADGRFPDNPRAFGYGEGQEDRYFSDNQKVTFDAAAIRPVTAWDSRLELRGGATWRSMDYSFGEPLPSINEQTTVWATPEWTYEGFEHQTWSVGVDLRRADLSVEVRQQLAGRIFSVEPTLEQQIAAPFIAGEIKLAEDWTLITAARGEFHHLEMDFDTVDPVTGTQRETGRNRGFAAQLGVRWQARPGLSFWTRYDRLYRFPVTDEIAAYQGYALPDRFNSELGPERGHNGEIGAAWAGGAGTLSVNVFAQRLDGEIVFDGQQNTNLAATRRVGTELSYRHTWYGWDLRLAYTWLEAKFVDSRFEDNKVPLATPHSLSSTLTTPRWLRSRLATTVLYRHGMIEGSDFANTQPEIPGWTVVNLALTTELTPSLTTFIRLNNIFDRQYATLKFYGAWYPAPGRQARAGLQWTF
ncbi:MAG: TonB-dependent receptor [Verrucomicrobiota bacterium JB022]|nr:TonB-dependent receptor [Verrucomicrobiota bacterium JB022]